MINDVFEPVPVYAEADPQPGEWIGECDICNTVDWLQNDGLCDECSERGDPALRSSVAKRGAMPSEETLRKYGIGFQDWERLFWEQGYACAICRSEFPRTSRGVWHTDHDHDVERNLGIIFIRGILCAPCNVKLATTRSTWTQDKRFIAYVIGPPGRAFGVDMSESELMEHSPMHQLARLTSERMISNDALSGRL